MTSYGNEDNNNDNNGCDRNNQNCGVDISGDDNKMVVATTSTMVVV